MERFKQFITEVNLDGTDKIMKAGSSQGRVRGQDGFLYVSHVKTKEEDRAKGHGHQLMKKITHYADRHKKDTKLVAIADNDDDHERLHKFYNKHGFQKEKGSMYMVRKHDAK